MKYDLNILDETLDMFVARVELESETCGLKHSKEDPAENHKAVDYLVQNLGDTKTKESLQQLRIPVCSECIEALNNTDWILMYCTYCHKSQWTYRPLAKYNYPEGNGIYWLDVCPFCAEIATEYKGEE